MTQINGTISTKEKLTAIIKQKNSIPVGATSMSNQGNMYTENIIGNSTVPGIIAKMASIIIMTETTVAGESIILNPDNIAVPENRVAVIDMVTKRDTAIMITTIAVTLHAKTWFTKSHSKILKSYLRSLKGITNNSEIWLNHRAAALVLQPFCMSTIITISTFTFFQR